MTGRFLLGPAVTVGLATSCGPRASYCSALEQELETGPCLEEVVFAGARECRRTLRTACDARDFELLHGELECAIEHRATLPECEYSDAYSACLRSFPPASDTCQAALFRLYL